MYSMATPTMFLASKQKFDHSHIVNVNLVIMETRKMNVYQTQEMVAHRSPTTKTKAFLE